MSQDEPSLIRPDHADAAVSVTGGDSGFQAGFKPENVPHINLPDVPQDATGLPPEALAHIPTLTERVPAASDDSASPKGDTVPVLEVTPEDPAGTDAQPLEAADALSDATEVAEQTQEPQVEADTWVQQMQVRMDRLMDDIHNLNDRLDRLENKTKV
jgi:hypothetical protein